MSCLPELHKSQHLWVLSQSFQTHRNQFSTEPQWPRCSQTWVSHHLLCPSQKKNHFLLLSFLTFYLLRLMSNWNIQSAQLVNIATTFAKCYNGPIFKKADIKFHLPFLHPYPTVSEPPTLLSNIQRNWYLPNLKSATSSPMTHSILFYEEISWRQFPENLHN